MLEVKVADHLLNEIVNRSCSHDYRWHISQTMETILICFALFDTSIIPPWVFFTFFNL